MAFTFEDLLEGLQASRANFNKHLIDLKPEQWDWQPYPECKSIRETLLHLILDDRSAVQAFETQEMPDFEAFATAVKAEAGTDLVLTKSMADDSFRILLDTLTTRYATMPLDTEISVFGQMCKLGAAIPLFSNEYYYHTGQVAFIRMASDPTWNYYAAIYGMEG